MNIFDQYGIKEVADVTLYSIHKKEDGSGDVYYVPALYLDTLKISSVEQTAENVWAEGGLGNSRLICWDYGKQLNVTLEDALCTPASLGLCWGGILGSDWKNGRITHDLGISYNDSNPVERLSRMEKAFYPKNNVNKSTISYLLPHTDEDKINNDLGILLNSKVVDGTDVCGHGYVNNHTYGWKMQIESDIQSIAVVPDRFFDVNGNSYKINQNSQVWVNNNLGLDSKFNIIYDINPLFIGQKSPTANVIIDMKKDPDYQSLGINLTTIPNEIQENTAKPINTTKIDNSIPVEYAEKLYINVDNDNNYQAYVYGRPFKRIDVWTKTDLLALANKVKDYPAILNKIVKIANVVDDFILNNNPNMDIIKKEIQSLLAIASENDNIIVPLEQTLNIVQKVQLILCKQTYSNISDMKIKDIGVFEQMDLRKLVSQVSSSTEKDLYEQDIIELTDITSQYILNTLGIYEYNDRVIEILQRIQETATENGFTTPTIIVEQDFSVIEAIKNLFLEDNANWYKPSIPIVLEQFKQIDMWNRFSSINEMIYFLITKYEDNIREIGVAKITDNGSRFNYKKTKEEDAQNENKLWAYINPSTMAPYPDNYWFHQGEPYYIKSLTLAPQGKKLKSQKILVKAGQFPGMYMMVGETYIRSRDTGEDERMQIKIPLCKVMSEQSITLEAAGDPTTFNLNLEVARPRTGILMELTSYEVSEKQEFNENGILETKDGSTEVLSE